MTTSEQECDALPGPVRSMVSSGKRLAVGVYRRETLGWLVLISLALHLTVFMALLVIPSAQPRIDASDPPSVDVVVEDGPAAAAPGPAAPTEAAAAATAPDAPVQDAEAGPPMPAPAPAPEVTPPPVQVAEAPPPPPAPAPAPDVAPPPPVSPAPAPAPAPAPDVPPSPVQAELPPSQPAPAPVSAVLPPPPAPTPEPPSPPRPVQNAKPPPPAPAPAPKPVPPPPRTVAQRPAPPQHAAARPAAARAPVSPAGSPAPATDAPKDGQNPPSRPSTASSDAAWMGKLKQWWDQHSFYPREASQTNEGGNVKVHIMIGADGQVTSIDVVQSSGSSVLDAAAVAVFRNARLLPAAPGTPSQPFDRVLTLHYRPSDGG